MLVVNLLHKISILRIVEKIFYDLGATNVAEPELEPEEP
jgi:hypothetical protein